MSQNIVSDFFINSSCNYYRKSRFYWYPTNRVERLFVKNLFIYQYLRTSINTLRLKNNDVIKINLASIKNFKKKYNEEIIFIRIKDAGEIMFKRDSYETKVINQFFEENRIKGYFCDMNNDLSMFHEYDLHPNKKGYEFIQNCVLKILKDKF